MGNRTMQIPRPQPNQFASAVQPQQVSSTAQAQPSAQQIAVATLWTHLFNLHERHSGREGEYFKDYVVEHNRLKAELLQQYPEHVLGMARPQ